jgi:diaminopimelate epimerase
MNAIGKTNSHTIKMDVEGGQLEVSFDKVDDRFINVFLKGPATFVFKGEIDF